MYVSVHHACGECAVVGLDPYVLTGDDTGGGGRSGASAGMITYETPQMICRRNALIGSELLQQGDEAVLPDHCVAGGDGPSFRVAGRPQSSSGFCQAGECRSFGLPAFPGEPGGHLLLKRCPEVAPCRIHDGNARLCCDRAQGF